MKLQQLLSYTRRALDDFHMIEPGDHIAIGISGGKDSLALLYAMEGIRRFYPIPFTIEAISVDLGIGENDYTGIRALCEEKNIPFHVVKTQIGEIIFDTRKETNPCSLCAKMRKGAFNDKAKELGCNKLAYAHHRDDVIETLMMSLIFEGRYHTFSPVTYLDRMDLTLIRPLLYVEERDIVGFKNKYHLPVFKNPCPADGYTKREYTKELIAKLNEENPGLKDRLFHAVTGGPLPQWNRESDLRNKE